MDKNKVLAAAEHTARWLVCNQINSRLDANRGRFQSHYELNRNPDYSTGWDTGCSLNGLLAFYKRTGNPDLLHSAEMAGRYIMSLQILDPREKIYRGAFREVTPQSLEFCPRDATSAAWSLIYLAEATGNEEYLYRAVIFGDWLIEYGMIDGWPRWAVMTDQDHFYVRGSFQSGTGAFFHDLFMATHDPRYIDRGMRPIVECYVRDFFSSDGGIIVSRGGFDNLPFKTERDSGKLEFDMHSFNDDFGNIALMRAAEIFRDESYREKARDFARYLAQHQDPDGNYGGGRVPSAVPQALIYFHDLGEFYHDTELLAARDRTLEALLNMQFHVPDEPRLDGAFPDEDTGRNYIVGNGLVTR